MIGLDLDGIALMVGDKAATVYGLGVPGSRCRDWNAMCRLLRAQPRPKPTVTAAEKERRRANGRLGGRPRLVAVIVGVVK
jgi:hypothetical protein